MTGERTENRPTGAERIHRHFILALLRVVACASQESPGPYDMGTKTPPSVGIQVNRDTALVALVTRQMQQRAIAMQNGFQALCCATHQVQSAKRRLQEPRSIGKASKQLE